MSAYGRHRARLSHHGAPHKSFPAHHLASGTQQRSTVWRSTSTDLGSTGQHQLSIFYNGTPDVFLERNFTGRFIAPKAKVYVGAGSQLNFAGGISAKNIEVRPDVQSTCRSY